MFDKSIRSLLTTISYFGLFIFVGDFMICSPPVKNLNTLAHFWFANRKAFLWLSIAPIVGMGEGIYSIITQRAKIFTNPNYLGIDSYSRHITRWQVVILSGEKARQTGFFRLFSYGFVALLLLGPGIILFMVYIYKRVIH